MFRAGSVTAILINTLAILALSSHSYAQSEFKIVANKKSGVATLSNAELRQIFRGEKSTWANGNAVTLVIFSYGTSEEKKFSKDLLGMTSTQAKKHYMAKVFSGALAGAPKQGEDAEEVIEIVEEHKGAIGYVPAHQKTGNTVLLKVSE